MNEESVELNTKLNMVAKAAYVLTIIAMAAINCRFHSLWWLTGYGVALAAASTSLANYKLTGNQAGTLLLVGSVQLILAIVGLFVSGVWIPIIEILICTLAAGNLHNLWEAAEKEANGSEMNDTESSSPETTTSSNPGVSHVNQEQEERLLKSQIAYWARHREHEEAIAYLKVNSRNKMLASVLENMLAEGNSGDMQSLYSVGFIGVCNGMIKNSTEELDLGIQLISLAAQNDYDYAMAYVAGLYHKVHYENTGTASKQIASVLLQIAQGQCDPEYCYRKTSYML